MTEIEAIVALQRATCDVIERLFSGGPPLPRPRSVPERSPQRASAPQKTADAVLPPPDGYRYWRCSECGYLETRNSRGLHAGGRSTPICSRAASCQSPNPMVPVVVKAADGGES